MFLPSQLSFSSFSLEKCPSPAPFVLDCCCCCCCCLSCTGCTTRSQTAETCELSMLYQKWSWIIWIINDILQNSWNNVNGQCYIRSEVVSTMIAFQIMWNIYCISHLQTRTNSKEELTWWFSKAKPILISWMSFWLFQLSYHKDDVGGRENDSYD